MNAVKTPPSSVDFSPGGGREGWRSPMKFKINSTAAKESGEKKLKNPPKTLKTADLRWFQVIKEHVKEPPPHPPPFPRFDPEGTWTALHPSKRPEATRKKSNPTTICFPVIDEDEKMMQWWGVFTDSAETDGAINDARVQKPR